MGRTWRWVLVVSVLAVSMGTACAGLSVSGGIVGTVVGVVLAVLFLGGTAATQTGCAQACLSILTPRDAEVDAGDVRPCLTVDAQPCLSDAGIRDEGTRDAVGPCLTAPYDAGRDAESDAEPSDASDAEAPDRVGPCLSDVSSPDVLRPCLTLDGGPRPDAASDDLSGDPRAPAPGPGTRQEAIARLAAKGVLPPDVAEKLLGLGKKA